MSTKIELGVEKTRNVTLGIQRTREINLGLRQSQGSLNYNVLYNKPSINYVELVGNKTGEELYLQDAMDEITPQEIDNILYGG